MIRQEEPGRDGPFEPSAASDRLGWVGLKASRYRDVPYSEVDRPALTHHTLVLATRPPEELDLMYEGVKRHVPPPAGSIMLVPAGCPSRWRWRGRKDSLHICLEPGLFARVAAEAFDLDPARLTVPPLDGLDLPHLRVAMGAEVAAHAGFANQSQFFQHFKRLVGVTPGRFRMHTRIS